MPRQIGNRKIFATHFTDMGLISQSIKSCYKVIFKQNKQKKETETQRSKTKWVRAYYKNPGREGLGQLPSLRQHLSITMVGGHQLSPKTHHIPLLLL